MLLLIINSILRHPLTRAVLPFFLAIFTYAAGITEYRHRIEAAAIQVEELQRIAALSPKDAAYENEIIADIREKISPTEKIEWQGSTVETSNQWLAEKLEIFRGENNAAKRRGVLAEIHERLISIAKKISEVENPVAANRTKDEDRQKLAEILKSEEYQKPEQKEESLFQRWMREFMEWLAGLFPETAPSQQPMLGSPILSYLVIIAIFAAALALIVYLVYRFAPGFAARRAAKKKEKREVRVILGERIAAGESAEDLFGEAERLAREGRLRDAIRKGYIAVLCELSDRKLIGLARHKTNRDYLRDVNQSRELFENMNGMTGSFERHWYGFQNADDSDWLEFRSKYRKIVAS